VPVKRHVLLRAQRTTWGGSPSAPLSFRALPRKDEEPWAAPSPLALLRKQRLRRLGANRRGRLRSGARRAPVVQRPFSSSVVLDATAMDDLH
jgi:hypothetical protein